MVATMHGQICIAPSHLGLKSWTLAKSRAKRVVLMEYKIKEKRALTVEALVHPAKIKLIANGAIGNTGSVQRRVVEVREQITERNLCTSQTEEKLVRVLHG